MKHTLFLCAFALNAAAAEPVLVRITPATLARLQARDPMVRVVDSGGRQTQAPIPAGHPGQKESTILHDGCNWTLVPNGALLHLPAAMKERVNAKPVGKLLQWPDFLARNQSWITTNEVTFDEAAGNVKIPAGTNESWVRQGKVVVAVHQNDPASVRVTPLEPSLTSR